MSARHATADDGASLRAEPFGYSSPVHVYLISAFPRLDPARGITTVHRQDIGQASRSRRDPRRFTARTPEGHTLIGRYTLTDAMRELWKRYLVVRPELARPPASDQAAP
jgi:hypothetical protein